MPHASLKLVPGVDQNKTPALNEAGISESNLIRFIPDRNGLGLVQKLGGWTQFFPDPIESTVRALHAWQGLSTDTYLAIGAEDTLSVLVPVTSTSRNRKDITPQTTDSTTAVSFTTTTGANGYIVNVDDTGSNIDNYDSVWIKTQVSVGGLILFGVYQCYAVSANQFQIYARDKLGNLEYASSAVAAGGAVAQFATTNGSASVTVTLNNHGYLNGTFFPVLVPTTVGGITFSGVYEVSNATTNTFTITANNTATSTTTGFMNGGNAEFTYFNGVGPLAGGTGYGILGYGRGGYGTGTPQPSGTGTPISATDWSLDNWGETLLSCPAGGAIYYWSPTSGNPIGVMINTAPPVNDGMFVAMPQRQVIAWGTTFDGVQDPLLIRWSDVGNFNQWIGLVENQAGSYRIPKGSKIVSCIQGPQQGLVWTDLSVWAMQYIGYPDVYGFNEIGTGCGLISRKAAASMNGVIYWMSQSQFFRLAGSGPEPIPCPVWDVIFQDLDTDNLDKIRVAPNSRFGEISWFYPTTGNGGEISHYVKYNIYLNSWDFGELQRTAWINQSVLGPPIGAGLLPGGADPFIVQHETSTNAVNAGNEQIAMNSYFQTGYFQLQDGDLLTFIDQWWPDAKWGYYGSQDQGAELLLTFYVTQYAGDTPIAYGPFTLTEATQYVTPRLRGRLVSIRIESTDINTFWRLGNMRYRYQPDGKF
jgi:hypothetical protein